MEYYTRSYIQLIKPGITLSNVMTAVAGAVLAASAKGFSFMPFLGVTAGVAFVVASACVVNNMIDRRIDRRMKRTKKREIATGNIPLSAAALYALVLAIIGFSSLVILTNSVTTVLGAIAFLWYVVIYGLAKRLSPLSTIVGGVCGALPPLAGYTAIMGQIDIVGWTLFGLLMIWQLPHFYAISVFRRDDYAQAGLPVWSVRYGTKSTKAQILFWAVIFTLAVPLLTFFHATGFIYLTVMTVTALYWVYTGIKTYKKLDDEKWSRKMFGVSLLVLLTFCGSISVGGYLP